MKQYNSYYTYNMYKHTETNRFMLTDSDLRGLGLSRVQLILVIYVSDNPTWHMFCWTALSHYRVILFSFIFGQIFLLPVISLWNWCTPSWSILGRGGGNGADAVVITWSA